ncbi:MAG: acyl-CoA dehydrogenase, partial [Pseudonocardiaceae bacterium]
MDFAPDERTHALVEELREFLNAHVYPAEARFAAEADQLAADGQPWTTPPVMAELTAEARRRGLWNLFQPDPEHGAGLS